MLTDFTVPVQPIETAMDKPKLQPLPQPIRDAGLIAKLIYLYLKRKKPAPHSVRSLAHALGISAEATRRGLDELEALETLERKRDGNQPAVLKIVSPSKRKPPTKPTEPTKPALPQAEETPF